MPAVKSSSPALRVSAQRAIEGAAIASCATLWAWLAMEAASDLGRSGAWLPAVLPTLAAAAVLGLILADLLSGLVHFLCDTFFEETTPVIGHALIGPFRDHHRDPTSITRHGFCERNGNNCGACMPVLAAALAAGDELGTFGQALTLSATFGMALTNQVHAWAHAARVPSAIAWLQRAGLILSPARHAVHHCHAHDRSYCITTGWLNPWLDRLDVFTRLERFVRALAPDRAP
jgi:hypothetical protein